MASLSLHFDPSLLALCWRSVSKLSSCCLDSFAVLPHIITELCGAIMAVAKQSAMLVDSLIEKRLKSGRFLCSLLLRYFSAFPEVAETCGRVTVDMLLSVHQTIHSVNDVSLRSKLESSFLLLVGMATYQLHTDHNSLHIARATTPINEQQSSFCPPSARPF